MLRVEIYFTFGSMGFVKTWGHFVKLYISSPLMQQFIVATHSLSGRYLLFLTSRNGANTRHFERVSSGSTGSEVSSAWIKVHVIIRALVLPSHQAAAHNMSPAQHALLTTTGTFVKMQIKIYEWTRGSEETQTTWLLWPRSPPCVSTHSRMFSVLQQREWYIWMWTIVLVLPLRCRLGRVQHYNSCYYDWMTAASLPAPRSGLR